MKTTKITMITKIRKYLFLIYITLIPLIYISYVIYRRLIVVRLPRDLFIALSPLQTFFIALAIVFLLLRLKSLLIAEKVIADKEPSFWFFVKLNKLFIYLSTYWISIYANFFDTMVSLPKIHLLVLRFLTFFHKLTIRQCEMVYFSLEILPKLIVVSCFFIDIFIFKQFYYFYKVLGLLLIPLFVKIVHYIISRFGSKHIEPMIDSLTSKPIPGTDLHEFCFKDPKTGYLFIKDIDEFIENHFNPVFEITYLLWLYYFTQLVYYFNRINIIITLLYLIGWISILLGSFLAS